MITDKFSSDLVTSNGLRIRAIGLLVYEWDRYRPGDHHRTDQPHEQLARVSASAERSQDRRSEPIFPAEDHRPNGSTRTQRRWQCDSSGRETLDLRAMHTGPQEQIPTVRRPAVRGSRLRLSCTSLLLYFVVVIFWPLSLGTDHIAVFYSNSSKMTRRTFSFFQ